MDLLLREKAEGALTWFLKTYELSAPVRISLGRGEEEEEPRPALSRKRERVRSGRLSRRVLVSQRLPKRIQGRRNAPRAGRSIEDRRQCRRRGQRLADQRFDDVHEFVG